jgi:hypothetical protein
MAGGASTSSQAASASTFPLYKNVFSALHRNTVESDSANRSPKAFSGLEIDDAEVKVDPSVASTSAHSVQIQEGDDDDDDDDELGV